jgi:hypothetical protein
MSTMVDAVEMCLFTLADIVMAIGSVRAGRTHFTQWAVLYVMANVYFSTHTVAHSVENKLNTRSRPDCEIDSTHR